jgi:hypothetical protein
MDTAILMSLWTAVAGVSEFSLLYGKHVFCCSQFLQAPALWLVLASKDILNDTGSLDYSKTCPPHCCILQQFAAASYTGL